jgi:hypothetical protein
VSTIYSHGGAGNGVGAQGVSRARETPAKLANVLGSAGTIVVVREQIIAGGNPRWDVKRH